MYNKPEFQMKLVTSLKYYTGRLRGGRGGKQNKQFRNSKYLGGLFQLLIITE